ncbi:hypothetical protein [Thiolapillus brandeum]|uniref:Uncharacterized protein n=1 Tax=Thiolapillus brandeum TaxID=1076588 RepID=A0A7U6GLC8_9GAMM|nr:hypothetical protein [Thiolapillus brandeum]BAO45782.1 hypothetical protein TBH_P209 [Thiolapillus brandeum]
MKALLGSGGFVPGASIQVIQGNRRFVALFKKTSVRVTATNQCWYESNHITRPSTGTLFPLALQKRPVTATVRHKLRKTRMAWDHEREIEKKQEIVEEVASSLKGMGVQAADINNIATKLVDNLISTTPPEKEEVCFELISRVLKNP